MQPPAPAQPPVTLADVERATREAAEAAVAKAAEQFKPLAPAAPPKLSDNLAEVLSIVAAVDNLRGEKQTQQEPPQQQNPLEVYRTIKEQLRDVAEEFAPQQEERGVVGQVLGLFETGLKTIDRTLQSPTGQRLAGAMVSRFFQPPAAHAQQGPPAEGQQQGGAAQQQSQAQQLPPAFVGLLDSIVDEATRDAEVDKAADIIEGFIKAVPEYGPELQELLSAPSVLIAQTVAQLSGCSYLTKLPHVVAWFDSLKEELTEREQERAQQAAEEAGEDEDAGELPATNSNGHRAARAESAQAS